MKKRNNPYSLIYVFLKYLSVNHVYVKKPNKIAIAICMFLKYVRFYTDTYTVVRSNWQGFFLSKVYQN